MYMTSSAMYLWRYLEKSNSLAAAQSTLDRIEFSMQAQAGPNRAEQSYSVLQQAAEAVQPPRVFMNGFSSVQDLDFRGCVRLILLSSQQGGLQYISR